MKAKSNSENIRLVISRSNQFNINVGDSENLGEYVALLGDSFVIEGIRIKFVGTGDYETIEISKA